MGGGIHRVHRAAELLVEFAEAIIVPVEDPDIGAHANGDLGGMGAGNTAADDHDLGGGHAGHAAQQNAAAPALGAHQRAGRHLHGHAARHLAHRAQQRQAAARIGDGFIGNRQTARFHQALCLHGIGRQVEISEEGVVFGEARGFFRLRLFHLHDQFALAENGICIGQDGRADSGVGFICKA